MEEAPVNPGDVLAGKYRVERVLGVGGMGVVVAATHLELQELRALKFMLPSVLHNAVAVERFLREARAAARLKTEHIAKVYDIGRLENGAPYMVMEHLEGMDLRTLSRRRGPFSVHLVALWAIQICEALSEAHALGIVHRDLKPANLFVTRRHDGSPCVKVLDFGISKITSPEGGEMELTKTHEVIGSPLFMSPEQLQSVRSADVRADLWSLGVVLYVLVTGRMPFRGEGVTEIITAVVTASPARPSEHRPEIPAELDEVILRCLRRDREQRYQTAAELAAALHPFVLANDAAAMRLSSAAIFAPMASSPSLGGDGMGSRSHRVGLSASEGAFLPPGVGATSAPSMSGTAVPEPSLASEHTGASWGNTSSRVRSGRWGVAIGGGAVLLIGAVLGYRHWASAPAPAAPSGAPTSQTAAPPSAPALPNVTASAPIVVPAFVDAGASSASPRASASASASASAAAAPKASRRVSDDGDPFGNSRK